MSTQLEELNAAVAALEEVTILAKARVSAYTRTDGTFVAEHDDKRQAAAPKQEAHLPDEAKRQIASIATSDAAPEHKKAAIDAIVKPHLKPAGQKPSTPDAVKDHARAAGAKFRSGVSVYSSAANAHAAAERDRGIKGGAFVMTHPDHDHHVVVNGADAQRMERNGYRLARPGESR